MDKGLQKKMDQYNELMLRSTALTFSLEGLSRDLKVLLARKTEFLVSIAESTAKMIGSRKRPKSVDALVDHLLEEVKGTNHTLNYVIMKILEKETSLAEIPQEASPIKKASKKPRKSRKLPKGGK